MNFPPFVLLYDYRCPFARNVHQHVLTALDQGADLSVTFEPYTLSQGHVAPGSPDAWDDPAHDGSLLALEVSVAVRDNFPDRFLELHGVLFEARHAEGVALTTREQISPLLEACSLDPGSVFALVDSQGPRRHIADRWRHYHDELDVFGVPTFIVDDSDATFVRLMSGPDATNPAASVATVERLLDLITSHADINELKHTKLQR